MKFILYIEDYISLDNGFIEIWADFVQKSNYEEFSRYINFPLTDNSLEYKTVVKIIGETPNVRLRRGEYFELDMSTCLNNKCRISNIDDSYILGIILEFQGIAVPLGKLPKESLIKLTDIVEKTNGLNQIIMAQSILKQLESNLQEEDSYVSVNNVGQGNWNELHVGNCVPLVYDIGTSLYASAQQVRKLIDTIYPRYTAQSEGPILTISHWDIDHYHCLMGMSKNELSKFTLAICSPFIRRQTAVRALEKLIDANVPILFAPIGTEKKANSKMVAIENVRGAIEITWFSDYCKVRSDINIASIQMLIRKKDNYVLLFGDGAWYQGNHIIDLINVVSNNEKINIVIPHHGSSKDKTYLAFITKNLATGIAAISVDQSGNNYGHPSRSVVTYLARNFTVERTDLLGKDIHISI